VTWGWAVLLIVILGMAANLFMWISVRKHQEFCDRQVREFQEFCDGLTR